MNIKKIGAIIFNIGAVVLFVLSILINDKLIITTILFAVVAVILSTTDKSAISTTSTIQNKSSNKTLLWISFLLIVAGITFAIIV